MLSSWTFVLVFISLILLAVGSTQAYWFNLFFVLDSAGAISWKSSFNSMLFLVFVILISLSAVMWACFYMSTELKLSFFYISLFSFIFSMILLLLSSSLFSLLLGWEGLGLTSFLLIIFYQNWNSYKGGLLTLLTNRLGDAVLLISFSYWMDKGFMVEPFKGSGFLMSMILISVISMTKSAQVPFTSWLPAAMAAPTPVSALVHSSTLVTAGIWLLMRFSIFSLFSSAIWFLSGLLTLMVASLGALNEVDSKKLVALSTLSQLGLMFTSLSLGSFFITLFHLLTHALAKASLFFMVGTMIHGRFSQQDVRLMVNGKSSSIYFSLSLISVFSLSSLMFFSGFFSKDFVLMSSSNNMSAVLSFLIFFMIITLTLTYCVKLLNFLLQGSFNKIMSEKVELMSFLPSFTLSVFSLSSGWIVMSNFFLVKLYSMTHSGVLWVFLVLSIFLFYLPKGDSLKSLFNSQLSFTMGFSFLFLMKAKLLLYKLTSSFFESTIMSLSYISLKFILISSRLVFLLMSSMMMLFLL